MPILYTSILIIYYWSTLKCLTSSYIWVCVKRNVITGIMNVIPFCLTIRASTWRNWSSNSTTENACACSYRGVIILARIVAFVSFSWAIYAVILCWKPVSFTNCLPRITNHVSDWGHVVLWWIIYAEIVSICAVTTTRSIAVFATCFNYI